MKFGMCLSCIQNIGPLIKVYNTRLCKKMENKDKAHFEAHYQKELDDVKSNMARMTSLLEHLMRAQYGKGHSVSSRFCNRHY